MMTCSRLSSGISATVQKRGESDKVGPSWECPSSGPMRCREVGLVLVKEELACSGARSCACCGTFSDTCAPKMGWRQHSRGELPSDGSDLKFIVLRLVEREEFSVGESDGAKNYTVSLPENTISWV